MENVYGKLMINYNINGRENKNITNSVIRELVGTSYEIYENENNYVSTQLVYYLSNSVQTKFYQLLFPLEGTVTTEESLVNLLSIARKYNFHVLYDGERLNLLSNFLIFGTTRYNLSYYIENYKGIKNSIEKHILNIGLSIQQLTSDTYEKGYIYKLGFNQKTKKPVVPMINQILLEDYYSLVNGREFSQQEIERFFNLDAYIRTLLFPSRIN